MAYIHNIYKVLAAILDPNSDPNYLKQALKETFDWELLVKVGSQQLVLPAIYCNLKYKGLLDNAPEDLQAYLEEITSINRSRNETILEEILRIGTVFKANNIDYVFLKGAALLVSEYYKDLGERMVGDVDVLVHPNQLFKAQNLLLESEYNEVETTFGYHFFENKHLARLIPKNKLAAVEIHRRLLQKPIKNVLEPLLVLQSKQTIKGIAICSDTDLLIHTVLNFQINDYGYYYNYLGLRNAYDVLVISNRMSKQEVASLLLQKYIDSFFDKLRVYFKIDWYSEKKRVLVIDTHFFVLKQQYKFLSKTSYFFLNAIKTLGIYCNKFFMMLISSTYRKESYKCILRLLKKKSFKI